LFLKRFSSLQRQKTFFDSNGQNRKGSDVYLNEVDPRGSVLKAPRVTPKVSQLDRVSTLQT
jgi:hypothetical protein